MTIARHNSIAWWTAAALLLLPASAALAQERDAPDLLELASRHAQEYSSAFRDLTAEETMTIRFLNERGSPQKTRKILSALLIYNSSANPNAAAEYRDVESVDDQPVREREHRAFELLQSVSNERSARKELERITKESSRHNLGVSMVNFTLNQGLPLRLSCRHLFQFGDLGKRQLGTSTLRAFDYRQTAPCPTFHYTLQLPPEFLGGARVHRGTIWLDNDGRLVREERDVYVQSTLRPGMEAKIVHAVFQYGPSPFGILVPVEITIEIWRIVIPNMYGTAVSARLDLRPYLSITQIYSGFSRFEVSVVQKVEAPKEK